MLSLENITIKGPGLGLMPKFFPIILGKKHLEILLKTLRLHLMISCKVNRFRINGKFKYNFNTKIFKLNLIEK